MKIPSKIIPVVLLTLKMLAIQHFQKVTKFCYPFQKENIVKYI